MTSARNFACSGEWRRTKLESQPMEMSAEEIKQFWRGFCQRRKISADVVAKGEAIIDKDPDYWADQTMGDLLESISGKKPS